MAARESHASRVEHARRGERLPNCSRASPRTIVETRRRFTGSGQAGAGDGDGQRFDAAGARGAALRGVAVGGGADEQRAAIGAAEHAGEGLGRERHACEHAAPLGDAHALGADRRRVSDGALGIEADAVRRAVLELRPDAPVGEAAVGLDVEGGEARGERLAGQYVPSEPAAVDQGRA